MKMKNVITLLLALSMVFLLCACNSATNETPTTQATTQATESKPAETTEPAIPEGKAVYTVKVVDEGGNPVAGAMVQLCLEACIPGATNAEGVASFTVDVAAYKVSFIAMPEGYTSDATEFYFDGDSTEMTITLKAVA